MIEEVIVKIQDKKSNTARASLPSTPAITKLTGAFTANKGKLPWPVAKGVVLRYFGKQEHPSLKRVYIQNNGIDINAEAGAKVSAVFKGQVTGVQTIGSFGTVVIIQHGQYYTVYSNLSRAYVKKGESIKMGQELGRLLIDDEGQSSLHFEIWNKKKKINPIYWIAKKK